ncbi:MAG: hypothetical protein KatS3mg031_3035 [Chitinophagales bacterium]|nr:MAG: hypothetical protein KatS3mg031_3035 [Chitinophagales bacterium]
MDAHDANSFVAINYITCRPEYATRFEELFKTRAHAIDHAPGFRHMYVLKPLTAENKYLVISHWESEQHFKAWTRSAAFLKGHQRGFADLQAAKAAGKEPPMQSEFKTYQLLTR